MLSTVADCYILKYLLLNLAQNDPGLWGDFGHNLNIHVVFQSDTASRIENDFVCDLFRTRCKFLIQTATFIIKPTCKNVRFKF